MAEHSYAGLYYPFIHFKDDRWLKLSALYWDRMGRIVPNDYVRDDSATVKALGSFVINVPPERVSSAFGDRFGAFVTEYGSELRKLYGLNQIQDWGPVPTPLRPPAAGGGSGIDWRLSYVFYEKMSDGLESLLVQANLARRDYGNSQWVGMHPRLADVYATAMADQLAADEGLYPVTDETVDHVAVGGWTMERLAQALLTDVELVGSAPTSREVETVAAYVAIETIIPRDIAAVPIDKILAFRDKYPAERAAFQKYVREFVAPREWLSGIANVQALEERLRAEYEKHLKPRVSELREQYHDAGIGTAVSAMTIQVAVPNVVAHSATALGVDASPIGGLLAGAALALVPVLRDRARREQALRTSDVSYLMRLEQNLRPRTMMNWIWKATERFRIRATAAPAS